jgi:3-oxoadipate enol-lactonase
MTSVLILVHGAGRSGRTWRRPSRRLTGDYRVIAPDLPGFRPRSQPRAERFRLSDAAHALACLARNQDPPVHVVGQSLGGMVVLHAAAQHPDIFASVIVTGTPVAPGRFQPSLLRRYRRIPDQVARAFSDAMSWHDLIDEVAHIDLRPDLPLIRVPTLVVCGKRDRPGLSDARLLAATIPAARLLVLPHIGHGWVLTAPQVFASIVRGFHATIANKDSNTQPADP